MLRIRNLSNKYQKRLIRPLYAQTQATPYAATLDPSLRNTDGSFRAPLAADTLPVARSAAAFALQGGLVPGTCMVKAAGEGMVVHPGTDVATLTTFGLLANFVGGNLDDLFDENQIGVWRGPDSVYELLAPAYDDTGLAAAYAATTPGNPVKLFAGVDGRLSVTAGVNRQVVAHLIERASASKIIIDLKV